MLHTSDGGVVWQPREVFATGAPVSLVAMSFPQPEVGVVVGAAGVILRTEDGGDTWGEQSSRVTTADLNGVAFAPGDNGTGMAVGAVGTVLRTTDAGDSWTSAAEWADRKSVV